MGLEDGAISEVDQEVLTTSLDCIDSGSSSWSVNAETRPAIPNEIARCEGSGEPGRRSVDRVSFGHASSLSTIHRKDDASTAKSSSRPKASGPTTA